MDTFRFNKEFMKNLLYSIAIIKNENKETILRIFDYLTNKYNFTPKLISMDFSGGPYTALKEKYHNCRIFQCYFHIMQKIYLHLPEIKKTMKK